MSAMLDVYTDGSDEEGKGLPDRLREAGAWMSEGYAAALQAPLWASRTPAVSSSQTLS